MQIPWIGPAVDPGRERIDKPTDSPSLIRLNRGHQPVKMKYLTVTRWLDLNGHTIKNLVDIAFS